MEWIGGMNFYTFPGVGLPVSTLMYFGLFLKEIWLPPRSIKFRLGGLTQGWSKWGMSMGRACTPDSVGKFCSPGLKEFRKQFLHFPPVAEAFNQIHPYIYIYRYINISIYRYIDLSIYRYFDISIYRYIDLSIYRFIDISIYLYIIY